MSIKTFFVLLTIALVGVAGTAVAVFWTTGTWGVNTPLPSWAINTMLGITMSFVVIVVAKELWKHEKSLKPPTARSPS
ncbi:MAG: hypothetical protein WCT37_01480 [Patescibacteria group bacterium]|jgi:hypothetical protein